MASSSGYLGLFFFFVLNLSPTSLRGCSPFLHWTQACEVEEQVLCHLLSAKSSVVGPRLPLIELVVSGQLPSEVA